MDAMQELGRAEWEALHMLAYLLPDRLDGPQQLALLHRLRGFTVLLPCYHCRHHFGQYMARNPPHLATGPGFARWTVDAHNDVNARLGKPLFSYASAQEKYGRGVPMCKPPPDPTTECRQVGGRGAPWSLVVVALVVTAMVVAVIAYALGKQGNPLCAREGLPLSVQRWLKPR